MGHVWVGPSGERKPWYDAVGAEPALELTPPTGYRRPGAEHRPDPSGSGPPGSRRTDPHQKKRYTAWYILVGIGLLVVLYVILVPGRVTRRPVADLVASAPATRLAQRLNSPASPARDVTVTACRAEAGTGRIAVRVVVTNHSATTSGYAIRLVFMSKDGTAQIGTGNITVGSIAAGGSSPPLSVLGVGRAPANGYACRLSTIERYARIR